MDLRRFKKLGAASVSTMTMLRQDKVEWRSFIEFASRYFEIRGLRTPTVVEIGIMFNAQKAFYVDLMGAEHIGVDCNPNAAPDILGDSHDPATVARVREALGGRPIDLLFIDADHSYDAVKRDFDLWAPAVPKYGLIAFHDIAARVNSGVSQFWAELKARQTIAPVEFVATNAEPSPRDNRFVDMGIGVIIKG